MLTAENIAAMRANLASVTGYGAVEVESYRQDVGALLDALEAANAEAIEMRAWAEEAAKAENENAGDLEAARDTIQRLTDLVRYQRGPLHDTGLISDEEYAVLAGDHAAVARLEGYDALRAALTAAQAEVDAGRAHTLALEQQNISLLRWQSVASDAHVDHLCRIIRSLAVSDETPRVLRDLSAMGVEDEVRRAVNAERINREKSELSAREWRKKAEDAEADLLTERAEDAWKERAAVVTFLRAEAGDYAVGEAPLDSADAIERGEHRREEEK
jgi:hypothetical protein